MQKITDSPGQGTPIGFNQKGLRQRVEAERDFEALVPLYCRRQVSGGAVQAIYLQFHSSARHQESGGRAILGTWMTHSVVVGLLATQ